MSSFMSPAPAPVAVLPAAMILKLSSLGLGTYLGAVDDATDEQVLAAVLYSTTRGWNVIDTGVLAGTANLQETAVACWQEQQACRNPRSTLPQTACLQEHAKEHLQEQQDFVDYT
jgi:hypothetical protein